MMNFIIGYFMGTVVTLGVVAVGINLNRFRDGRVDK